MDVAEHIGRGVRLFLKVYLTLLVSCALMQMLMSWICSIRLTIENKFELWLAFAIASVIAYCIHRCRHPRPARTLARHGSERTPLMPRNGGRR
jgi:hypothetical protein